MKLGVYWNMLASNKHRLRPTRGDSASAESINSKRNTSSKLRHPEIEWFYCRYLAEAGVLATLKIDGDGNVSDLFTKALVR